MKKIFALILCLMLLCAMPLATYAEEVAEDTIVTEEEVVPPEDVPEETPTETPTETPEADETPTEDAPTFEDEVKTVTDNIAKWLEKNSGFIGLIVTIIGYGIVSLKKLGTIIKSAGIFNNNAITMARNNKDAIDKASATIENASAIVTGYDARIVALLEAFKTTAEDKARLEKELVEIKNYLKTSTDANVEFANELAELLGLSNIPNCKKDEIGSRHLEAVRAILEAEKKAEAAIVADTEEANNDVGEEKKN